jgi:AcrR family transcriptional regulator
MSARERLLDAARQCLLERGHQASSVKAIAERAGVNHGLVHHYFGSKERLWMEVVRREGERLRAALPTARAGAVERFYVPELLRHPDRLRLLMEFLPLANASGGVAAVLREHLKLTRALVQQNFGLPDEITTTWVLGAFFGMAIQGRLDPDLPVEQAAERLLERLAADERGPAEAAPTRAGNRDDR